VALLGLLVGSCSRDRALPTFPDAPVILISIDTLRADRLPLYGYTRIRTPFLDRFAKDAWLFENAYSPCPMTLPAHTTMLTGTLPPEHGVRNNIGFVFDPEAHMSLPRLLRQRAYATGAALSSYVLRFETGLGALFDFYEDSFGTMPGVQPVNYQRAGDKTAAFAQAWIGEHAGKPFFFLFHIYEPHVPYDPPEPFRSQYGVTYDGEVATSDAIVGAFLDTLKKLGVYDRAIVIVTSDHGEGLGEHGEQQHSIFLYREAIRVPLLVKLPANSGAGSRVAAPVQLSDIFPTVTAALGLPAPKEVSGTSLFAAGATGTAGRVIYGETLFPRLQLGWSDLRSVVNERYHYIQGPRPELYDIVADPGEKTDLVKSQTATAADLARALRRYPQGNEKPASVDQETMRRLSSLGYLGTLRDSGKGADLPNPADNLQALRRMEEAWHLGAEGRVPQAIEVLRSSVRENPGMFDAWVKLGELLSEAGLDEEAAAAYRQALDCSPVFLPDISVALGFVELLRQRFDEAERLARVSLATVPSKARELLAGIALARGDLAAAESEAVAAAAARNPQPSAILVLAEVKLRAGKPAEALRVVEKAQAAAREKRLGAIYNLEFLRGDALARMDRLEDAEVAFRAEIAAFPAHAQPYASLAVIRFMKGDRPGLDRQLNEMVRANPSPRSYLLAASTLDSLGEKEKAAGFRKRGKALNHEAPR
jgi:arylsulfatase A-like enzyme/Flp pilus assembly protein TadD